MPVGGRSAVSSGRIREGLGLGRGQLIHDDGWLLATEQERDAFRNDWPRGRRSARRLNSSKPTEEPIDNLIRNALRSSRSRGLILNARPRDGISWTAQAALDIVLDEFPRRQVSVFYNSEAALVPESFNIAGKPAVAKCARAAEVIARRRGIVIAVRFFVVLFLAALAAILSTIASIIVEQGTIDHSRLLPAYVIAGSTSIMALVARAIDLRQDLRPSTFDTVVEQANQLMQRADRDLRAQERIDKFIHLLYDNISSRGACRVVLVDELKKLHSLDRRLANVMLLSSTVGSPVKKLIILDSSREALQMKRRAPSHSCLAALETWELLPLDLDQLRAIALEKGLATFDPLQAIGTLDAHDPMETHWRATFRQAAQELAKQSEPADLHILWLMAISGLGPEQPSFRKSDWASALSSKSRMRDKLLHQSLCCHGLNLSFVRDSIQRLAAGPWRSAFASQYLGTFGEQIRLKPAAARAIAAEAWDIGFGRRGLASAYWSLYWDDYAASGHQRRTNQVAMHLVDAFHHQTDVAELASALPPGRLAETVERVLAQCLQFAELRYIAPLMGSLFEVPDVDRRRATSIAMEAFALTRDPDVALTVPDKHVQEPLDGSSLVVKRLSRLVGVQSSDRAKLAQDLLGTDNSIRSAMEVEQVVFDSVVDVVTNIDEESADETATIANLAALCTDALMDKVSLLTVPHDHEKGLRTAEAVAMLAATTASLSATSGILGLAHAVAARRKTSHSDCDLDRRIVATLEDAAIAARTLDEYVRRTPFEGQGSWPVVLDGACQHLGLVVVMTCQVLRERQCFQRFGVELQHLTDEMHAILEISKSQKPLDYVRPAELSAYLWMFLGLEGLATAAVLQFSALTVYFSNDLARVDEITKSAQMSDSDRAYLDVYRAYSHSDSLDLRAAYVARAAITLLRSSAAGPLRLDFATRALSVIGGYGNDNVRTLMTDLVREFGVDSVVQSCPEPRLLGLVNAVENLLGPERGQEDPTHLILESFHDAFLYRFEFVKDDQLRRHLDTMLVAWNLLPELRTGPIVWENFSRRYRSDNDNQWAWVLRQLLVDGDVTGSEEEVDRAYGHALDSALEREERGETVGPNELLFSYTLYRKGSKIFRSRCIELLFRTRWYAASILPIASAQDIVRDLDAEGYDGLFGVQSVLDARQLERDAATRIPRLIAAGRYFEIFDYYASILARYGLKVLETPEEVEVLAGGTCEGLLDDFARTGYIPECFSPQAGVSVHFLQLGRCLESFGNPPSDNLINAAAKVNYLARQHLRPLLQTGQQLGGLPERIRRVVLHHGRIHEGR